MKGDEENCEKVSETFKPRPEDILSAEEAETLQRADQGELPCPHCETPLRGEKLIIEDLYEGIVLVCLMCGFREY